MKISLLQILLCVGIASLWCAAVSRGLHLAGSEGAFIFAVFGACGAYAVGYSIFRQSNVWWRVAAISSWVTVAIVVAFPYIVWADYWHVAGTRQLQVKAQIEQQQLSKDPRFESVTLSYVSPWDRRGQWLRVSGTLGSQQAVDDLRQHLESVEDWHIEFDVAIDSD